MTMIKVKPGTSFDALGWMTEANSTPLGRLIVARAFLDVGIQETPPGSNRGRRIDEYLRRAGVPESMILSGKGWWCAAAVGAWFADCGALVPVDYASCDSWIQYIAKGVDNEPRHGSAILYGLHKANGTVDAHHIGIIARVPGILETIEGNRGFAGTTNNGVAVDINPPARKDILGYIHPIKAAA